MPTRQFIIKSGTPSDGKLDMTDRGNTEARVKYVIIWKIKNDKSNVASITSIELKTSPNGELFSSLGPVDSPENRKWKGVIKRDASPVEY